MATKSIAWDSGGGYIRLTYTGSGNGTISVESDENTLGTARSQVITVKTTQGGLVTKNLTVNQAACPFPVGDVKSYSYTGTVQSVLLPAGSYKLQCWGAQGGSNAAYSSYGITAKSGGKGGYSEGVLTLIQATTVYIFVGGKGSSSGNGGWNGGGGGTGSATGGSGGTNTVSRIGCGGGATDIALTTSSMSYSSYRNNRSSASLLSRIIVAGGGSGGAMSYVSSTTTTTTRTVNSSSITDQWNGYINGSGTWTIDGRPQYQSGAVDVSTNRGQSMTVVSASGRYTTYSFLTAAPVTTNGASQPYATGYSGRVSQNGTFTVTVPSNATYFWVDTSDGSGDCRPQSLTFTTTTTTTNNYSRVGYVGGGTSGGGSSTYQGRQNAAGYLGEFGKGANQAYSSVVYTGACGGGGWYGGGTDASNYSNVIDNSGGGSGFVNTSASSSNRPSGYTGLELDSGTTYDGASSFPNTAGTGNETGHSGNGYAKITRLS